MTTWTLIITLVGGRGEISSMHSINGFATKESCEKAAQEWRHKHSNLYRTTPVTSVIEHHT